MWGLAVVSVADPQSPKLLGTYTLPCEGAVCLEAVDVAVADGFAFVAGGYYGLLIINVTDPTTPYLVSRVPTVGYTYSVAASSASAVLYIGYTSGFAIVRISSLTTPVVVFIDIPIFPSDIVVNGNLVYIAGRQGTTQNSSGLIAIDATDPSAPVVLGSVAIQSPAKLYYTSGIAFVASRNGVAVVDVSDPSAMSVVRTILPTTSVKDVAYVPVDVYVYMALHDRGFAVYSAVADSIIGEYDTPNAAQSIYMSGSMIYVTDTGHLGGLYAYDVAAFQSVGAQAAGSLPIGNAVDIVVVGEYAYLAVTGGLLIVNVATPSVMSIAANYSLEGLTYALAVANNVVYIASTGAGLVIIDVSNPGSPQLLLTFGFSEIVSSIFVVGSRAYVGTQSGGGVKILDVSSPRDPVFLGEFTDPSLIDVHDVFVASDKAFITSTGAVFVVDVTYGTSPVLLYVILSIPKPLKTYVENNMIYVISSDYLYVAGIVNPRVVASVRLPGSATDVFVKDGAAYVASVGLLAYDVSMFMTEAPTTAAPTTPYPLEQPRTITKETLTALTQSRPTETDISHLLEQHPEILLFYYRGPTDYGFEYMVMCDYGACDWNATEKDPMWRYDNITVTRGTQSLKSSNVMQMALHGPAGNCSSEPLMFEVPIGECGAIVPIDPPSWARENLALWEMQGGVNCIPNGTLVVMVSPNYYTSDQYTCTNMLLGTYNDSDLSYLRTSTQHADVCFPSMFSMGGVEVTFKEGTCGTRGQKYSVPKDSTNAGIMHSDIAGALLAALSTALAAVWNSFLHEAMLRKVKSTGGTGAFVQYYARATLPAVFLSFIGSVLLVVGYAQYYTEASGKDTTQYRLLNGAYWYFIAVQMCACAAQVLYRARLLPRPTGLVLMIATSVSALPLMELTTHHVVIILRSIDRGDGCWLVGCTGPSTTALESGVQVAVAGGVCVCVADIMLVVLGCLVADSGEDPLYVKTKDTKEGDSTELEEEPKKDVKSVPTDNERRSSEPFAEGALEGESWKETRQYKLLVCGGAFMVAMGFAVLGTWAGVWVETDGWCLKKLARARTGMHWWYAAMLLGVGCYMIDAAVDARGSWTADRFLPVVLLGISLEQLLRMTNTADRLSEQFQTGHGNEHVAKALLGVCVVAVVATAGCLLGLGVSPDDPRWDVRAIAREQHMRRLEAEGKAYKPGLMTRLRKWQDEHEELMKKVLLVLAVLSLLSALYTFVSFVSVVHKTKDDMTGHQADTYYADTALVIWLTFFQVMMSSTVLGLNIMDAIRSHAGIAIGASLIAMAHTPVVVEYAAELARRYEIDYVSCPNEAYPLV
eukprot:TRINITY_DN1818_c0_g1_i4.p1 TRINITY_DN1818_c0_g1~~TRINITY_DN1818_c0_g1_i4.p1  ORF type:complete len:1320 (+),score=337.45 TRINITY_DN1818_c0_g1_i4:58-4017(+)